MTGVSFLLGQYGWRVAALRPADDIAGEARRFAWTAVGGLTLLTMLTWIVARWAVPEIFRNESSTQAAALSTEGKGAGTASGSADERFALAARGSNDGIWDWNPRNGELYCSLRWKQIVGLGAEEECRTREAWLARVHPDDAARLREELDRYALDGAGLLETEYRIRHTDGTWRWVSTRGAALRDAAGHARRVAGSQTDLTGGKLVDPLCGLPNRLSVLERLERLFERYREDPKRDFALLFLDLDKFKRINDSLGHQNGDELLLGVSRRIAGALRSCGGVSGCVGRLGGDEFVVLLDELPEHDFAARLAESILSEMEAPFHLAGSFVLASVSIGIAFGSGPGSNAESALQHADSAMYHAKATGRGKYAVFDRSMHARAIERVRLEADLRMALDRDEFVLYYQPQVCLQTGRLAGFEAFLRWRRQGRGLVCPAEFLAVAEETGLAVPLGRWVLGQACQQMASWRRLFGLESVTISMNLGCRQFTDPALPGSIREVLAATGLPAQALRLEVPESTFAEDPESAPAILANLAALGVGLEIDDFGTGYSSLSQLHRLPFDTLKVDHTFVRAMDRGPEGRKIVDSISTLARSLRIGMIAEGVESAEHWVRLENIGCHTGQGYYFGGAAGAAETTGLIRRRCTEKWPVPDGAGMFMNNLRAIEEAAASGGKAKGSASHEKDVTE